MLNNTKSENQRSYMYICESLNMYINMRLLYRYILLLIDVVFRKNTTVLVPNNLNSDIMCPANDTRVHYCLH